MLTKRDAERLTDAAITTELAPLDVEDTTPSLRYAVWVAKGQNEHDEFATYVVAVTRPDSSLPSCQEAVDAAMEMLLEGIEESREFAADHTDADGKPNSPAYIF